MPDAPPLSPPPHADAETSAEAELAGAEAEESVRADGGGGPVPPESAPAAQTAAPAVRVGPSLGQTASRGLVIMASQTLLVKAVNLFGQIALARLLLKEDFGLVGLAYTVSSFAYLLREAGLLRILVDRQKYFERWATPVFWLALSLGTLSGLLVLAAAPIAVAWYGNPRLWGLLAVLAVGGPLGALNTVPIARMLVQLRFGTQAAINLAAAVTVTVTSVVMAWLGFGPYSFVVSFLCGTLVQVALGWVAAPTPVSWNPRLRRWRFLATDSWVLLATGAAAVVVSQGDYIVLGRLADEATVGQYFLAFNLSMQTSQVVIFNLGGVLFPALSKLRDNPRHQSGSFLRASRLLCYVGMPLCLLQAALAGPGLRLFFGLKWGPTVPLLQILSLAIAVSLAGSQTNALIQAQGRFATLLKLTLATALAFVPLAYVGGLLGSAAGVAVAVLLTQALSTPLRLFAALRDDLDWGGFARLWLGPLLLGAATIGPAWGLGWGLGAAAARLTGDGRVGDGVALAATSLLATGFYALGLRRATPAVWDELRLRLRRRGAGAAA